MMAARKNTQTNTPDQIRADTVKLVTAVASTHETGQSAVKAATLASFTDNVAAYVALGQHCITVLAAYVTGALTGENIAKLFAKDGAFYPTDQDERDALKSAAVYTRALRVSRFHSAESVKLFLDGPAVLVARCAALQGVTGHTPGITAYQDWLGVMNASEIAQTKALSSDFLAKFNIFTDDKTGATIYAKRRPVSGTPDSTSVKFAKTDAPVIASVMESDHDALVKLVTESVYDLDIPADRLPVLAAYVLARYRLSLTESVTESVQPASKITAI